MYKHFYLINLSAKVKNIVTCINGKRLEDMLIISFIIFSMSILELYCHASLYGEM